jgi:hypothetical protein
MVRSNQLEASGTCSELLLPAMDNKMIRPRVLLRVVRFELDDTDTDTDTKTSTRTDVERKTDSPLFSTLTTETCAQLWYHTAEISAFKRQVGTILLSSGNKNQDDRCGLERHSIERDRAKKAAIKLVILAQSMQLGDSDDFLKLVSEKCSARAREMAFSQGFHDHCQVYYESLESIVDGCEIDSLLPSLGRIERFKRRASLGDDQRRVKQRASGAA